ncbi:MAG: VWA domain-containing protein [Chthonomonadales bacterium]|nr:VWA domain-containing protein [Chthonomonadales bacterium]
MALEARTNDRNPDPRVAVALLLDTSGSMEGEPIAELNRGFAAFCADIKEDPLARKRTEVTVITFGGQPQVVIPFTEGRSLEPRSFAADGLTPLGGALEMALDELGAQKAEYKRLGLRYYRPWLFVITDGSPTDDDVFPRAADRVRATEAAKGVTVFSVLVQGGDKVALSKISDVRPPVSLKTEPGSFMKLFAWLSASLGAVSNSGAYGASDSDVAQAESLEQNPLPSPAGWATW